MKNIYGMKDVLVCSEEEEMISLLPFPSPDTSASR